ncbi:MAG: aminotransferase class V-fold PLP-dependent enzyme [Planctomycetota bacterium]|nr:aminotransferase class V-fold PLP-dependent enzyme [Planctomycetota bacterium]
MPDGSDLARFWALDPQTVYLNHGSFGACPLPVLEAQLRFRTLMEADGVRFFVERCDPLLDSSRAMLAAFLNCRGEDLAFVPNATIGVATALAHLEPTIRAGDELLTNDHEYPACQNNLQRLAHRTGAKVVMADVPFPIRSPGEVIEAVLSRATERTKIALLSAVTSSSGLILPVREIARELEARGVAVVVDAAHAPGFLPMEPGSGVGLDVPGMGASFVTGNNHKWLCTPKGCAFLWASERHRASFRPLVLSNFAKNGKPGRSRVQADFDYIGTNDVTAWMAAAEAIRFMGSLHPGGWSELTRRNHELVLRGRNIICSAIGVAPPAPDAMLGSMATILLPANPPERWARLSARPSRYHDALQDRLLDEHAIQVPVWSVPDKPAGTTRLLRISAQAYNTLQQYEYLAGALRIELEREARGD